MPKKVIDIPKSSNASDWQAKFAEKKRYTSSERKRGPLKDKEVLHAKKRIRQRMNTDHAVSDEIFKVLEAAIRSDGKDLSIMFFYRQSIYRTWWVGRYRSNLYRILYNRKRTTVVTVIPVDRDVWEKKIRDKIMFEVERSAADLKADCFDSDFERKACGRSLRRHLDWYKLFFPNG